LKKIIINKNKFKLSIKKKSFGNAKRPLLVRECANNFDQKKGKAAIPSSMKTKAAASIVYIKETDSRQAML
jgi:hypothetical protein